MNNPSIFYIKIYKKLNSLLEIKINNFRKQNQGIRGKKRTKKELKIHLDKYCSDLDIKRWVIAFEDNRIIGMVAVIKRTVKIDDQNVILGGIGKVRVAIDRRKRGIASKMMIAAMKQTEELNCDVALLGTNLDSFLSNWYEKYGFVLLSKSYFYVGRSGKKYTNNDGMIVPIKSIEIFNKIQNSKKPLNIGTGNW